MKKNLVNAVFFVLILMWVPTGLKGQSMVASVGVDKANIDLRGSVQILDSLTITTVETGKAVLRFDGYCVASPGDKIFVAVSRTRVWGACDDNINVEVLDNDVNMAPFTHTRVFDLVAGKHTFYAVAHNYIELNGTGVASIYGNLALGFFGISDPQILEFREIAVENQFVSGSPQIFASAMLDVPESGKVHVSFDGLCTSSPGDLITLAACDENDWNLFNGGVLLEAYSGNVNGNSFSHSKVYDVGPGSHTFFAAAENLLEMDGNGRISVFGSFTAIFYPDKIKEDIVSHQVLQTAINVRDSDFVLDEITISTPNGGSVLAQYNGMASIHPGDKIAFALTGGVSFPAGTENINLESLDEDRSYRSFSNTKLFEVEPGEHTFYVLARNRTETDGTGIISTYGAFTLMYEGSEIVTGIQTQSFDLEIMVTPNPATDVVIVHLKDQMEDSYGLQLIDINGRLFHEITPSHGTHFELDVGSYSSGMYFIRLIGDYSRAIKPIMITR